MENNPERNRLINRTIKGNFKQKEKWHKQLISKNDIIIFLWLTFSITKENIIAPNKDPKLLKLRNKSNV